MDVVAARTDRSLGVAIRQLEGRLSQVVRSARDALLPLVAHIEATIDFPEDVPEMPRADLRSRIEAARDDPRLRGERACRAHLPRRRARGHRGPAERREVQPSQRASPRGALSPSSPRFRARRAT